MSTIRERFEHMRAHRTQREFAEALGVSLRSYQYYEREERQPPAEVLRALAGLGWSPTWVLTGEDEPRLTENADRDAAVMFAGAVVGDPEATQQWERHKKSAATGRRGAVEAMKGRPVDFDDYTFVPHLSVRAGAGIGQVVESEQIVAWMAFRKSYLQMLGVPSSAACLIRVRGHSMDPYLRNGDTILVDTSDTVVTAREGVYAFRVDATDELAVKTITLAKDAPGAWLVKGGDHWPEQVLEDADKPIILGRVRWSGRTWD